MNKHLIALLIAGVAVAGSPVMAQGSMGDAGRGGPGNRLVIPDDLEIPEEVKALRNDLQTLRDELEASRREALAALGRDATREELAIALEIWRESNEDAFASVRELSAELRAELEAFGLIGPREQGEVPEAIQNARAEADALQKALAESRKALVDSFDEDATVEDKRAAYEAWRAANADDLAALDQLRTEVRTWMQDNRPVRAKRAGMKMDTRQRLQAFRESAAEMRQSREQLREQLAGATTSEERQALIRSYREEQRLLMQERKNLKRLERLSDDGSGGDRRPGG